MPIIKYEAILKIDQKWLRFVFIACHSVTQMASALFGEPGPLFNVALIPLQLMTAGDILSKKC